ncbi:CorA family divalent cation transporter [Gilvimarinus sp. F26214L]|uniref:CorA family divalent cation transporter n=1 Tax=Gilvimarinus sp. DZF01 TaxID=3461371 RepID=UPI0040460B30
MNTPKRFASLVLQFEADKVRRLPIREVNLSEPPEGLRWVHFSGDVERTREWLQHNSPLDGNHIEALCSAFTRPRLFVDSERNFMLTLRTARTTDNAPLEFMSLRVWTRNKQLISVSLKPTEIIADFVTHLHVQRKSVVSAEQLVLELCQFVTREFTQQVHLLDEHVERLEDSWEQNDRVDIDELLVARQRISRISRYLAPQLEALQRTEEVFGETEMPKALKKRYQDGWREVTNRVRRDLEALTEMRERVAILSDTLQQASNERITRIMYALSIVATFFLPLTFVTGLLGMNVAGIPASESPLAFWAVCGLMVLIAVLQLIMFKRWHWLR